ncbi:hypothetical protein [Fluviicola chungangensis]|uniref:Uncharacterized protein n=1 Tax=Fluviicola chungangensis TaxID=2597671 RepID=A0A556N3F0_9FLAO|nr:hypothetical protein [Fluviicola chungangensis]TSJ46744.1 hypothetical protein FO442_06170 [Fluviicola chungangensis]
MSIIADKAFFRIPNSFSDGTLLPTALATQRIGQVFYLEFYLELHLVLMYFLLWANEGYSKRSPKGMLHHQTPALTNNWYILVNTLLT